MGSLRLAFQLSRVRGIREKKKERKKNENKIKTCRTRSSRCFQEPAAKAQRVWVSTAERGGEEGRRGGSEEEGGIGRTFLLLFLSLVFFSLLFFFSLAGTASDPICFQLPAEDDVSPLPVRYVLHMQKLQNILESHRCPLIPTSPPSPPHTIRWEQSDSSSL